MTRERRQGAGTDAWQTLERRATCEDLELRAAPDGRAGPGMLRGYAAVFNVDSQPMGGTFVERVARGAFARALRERQDVRALVAHDMSQVLGRTTAGTLRLQEDEKGLRVEVDLPDTQAGRDMAESVRRRDVRQMSFAFRARRPGGERWELRAGPGGLDRRVLLDVDLFDVSPLAFAAYPDTEVAMRSHQDYLQHAGGAAYGTEDTAARLESPEVDLLPGETRSCLSAHLGCYLMQPEVLGALVMEANRGELRALPAEERKPLQYTVKDGLAFVDIKGVLMRDSKMAASSTRALRSTLATAAADPEVLGILLRVDSPGGQALGTAELARAVRSAAAGKPVHAYVEAVGASAAYWVLSQAQRVTVAPMAEVGSIGTVAVLYDKSEQLRRDGIRVHVVATGPDKGLGADGSVPERLLEQVRERVAEVQEGFTAGVSEGRGLTGERLEAVLSGRTWTGKKALELGLVDALGEEADAERELRAAMQARAAAAPAPVPAEGLLPELARQRQAELGL